MGVFLQISVHSVTDDASEEKGRQGDHGGHVLLLLGLRLDTLEFVLLQLALMSHEVSLTIAELNGAVQNDNNIVDIDSGVVVTLDIDVGLLPGCVSIGVEICLQLAGALIDTAAEHHVAFLSHLHGFQCLVELFVHNKLRISEQSPYNTEMSYMLASLQIRREVTCHINHSLHLIQDLCFVILNSRIRGATAVLIKHARQAVR